MSQNATPFSSSKTGLFLAAIAAFALAGVALFPEIDLATSKLFYEPGKGFPLDYNPAFQSVHWLATYGAWILAAILLIGFIVSGLRGALFLKPPAKHWLFLLLALVIAPGLIGNVILKDHWGRARPAQVIEFGGSRTFSAALVPQDDAHKNGSFVAGDAAFGFFLPCFGYVLRRPWSRRAFWGGMGAGGLLSLLRISMGAHFLSDTLFAGFFMLITTAILHAAMYGRAATARCWRDWMFGNGRT